MYQNDRIDDSHTRTTDDFKSSLEYFERLELAGFSRH
jgi:hypothetical protein